MSLGRQYPARALRMLLVGMAVFPLVAGPVTLEASAAGSSPPAFSVAQIGQMQRVVSSYPDVFGGLAGNPNTHLVIISVSTTANARRRPIALSAIATIESQGRQPTAMPTSWTVQIVVRGPSQSTLNALMQRVTQQEPWRSIFGPHLTGFGTDPMNLDVVIGVDETTSKMTSAVEAFGAEVVVTTMPRIYPWDGRILDSQPYYGGDRLVTSDGTQCTGGVEVFRGGVGHYGMITAGHCWGNGTIVYQGYWSNGMHTSGKMGQVTESYAGSGYADGAFIDSTDTGTSLLPTVWTSNNNTAAVTNWDTNWVGESICTDGSFTYQNCTGVVDKTNFCIVIGVLYDCHLEEAYSSNGTNLGQQGDSGGPVYHYSGSGVWVTGFITGGPSSPSTTAWYTDYSALASELGVIVHT